MTLPLTKGSESLCARCGHDELDHDLTNSERGKCSNPVCLKKEEVAGKSLGDSWSTRGSWGCGCYEKPQPLQERRRAWANHWLTVLKESGGRMTASEREKTCFFESLAELEKLVRIYEHEGSC